MYLIGRFAPGKTILWHAGASSVSISGIQLSRGDNAAAVFATVRSDDKAAFCKEQLGATGAFNTKKTDWVDEVLKGTLRASCRPSVAARTVAMRMKEGRELVSSR